MRVLVIRPEPDATRTANRLDAAGHAALVAPVLATEFLDSPLPDDAALIVLTSGNAVRALARRPDLGRLTDLATVAVGAATAAAARELGFTSVVSAEGRAADVAATVARLGLKPDTKVLYPAATERADALDERLAALGLDVAMVEVYRTSQVEAWPVETVAALAAGTVDVVQVMSRRSGVALLALIARHGLRAAARGMACHAISAEAVTPDLAASFASVTIAGRPSLDGLLALLSSMDDAGVGTKPSNMR
jgi:uroporphyrinogen-III synthase